MCLDFLPQRVGLCHAAAVSADDVHAALGELKGHVATKATAGTGDECDFLGHGFISFGFRHTFRRFPDPLKISNQRLATHARYAQLIA
ncbi:diguanylate cyclase or its enzymatically inactive variants [Pseudomonas syringae pv. actinidiae]|uniref:Diguanylate cyclase or its enzymatically inactive variants n=1 Tax=Pseudomonas syringae pv. actinidiae TaxID=103796 RepID=A0A2V0QC35_PSESF|nr:diguanylate cyclase or its enzymatically inactive variants [Pseudomonas syringae pv. actinidiae]